MSIFVIVILTEVLEIRLFQMTKRKKLSPDPNFDTTKYVVLIIDDEPNWLTLLRIVFERAGFRRIVTALNGDAVFHILDQQTPDIIITNINLPDIDGINLCRILRSRPDTKDIPILIHSARGDPDSIQAGLAAGANEYLCKPTPPDKIVQTVTSLLKKKWNGAD